MNSTTRYFKGGTLLFTLSKHQRNFLANPPGQLAAETGGHVRRTASILARNGLLDLCGDTEPTVRVTDAGRAAARRTVGGPQD